MIGQAGKVEEGAVAGYKSQLGEMTDAEAIRYDGYWKYKEVEGTPEYKNGTGYDGWYKADGSTNFPPKGGAIPGTESKTTLQPGDTFKRYGQIKDDSHYVTQAVSDESTLSLPPKTKTGEITEFEVVKPIPDVDQSLCAPWAGDRGLGPQWALPKPIQTLEREGYIKEIKK